MFLCFVVVFRALARFFSFLLRRGHEQNREFPLCPTPIFAHAGEKKIGAAQKRAERRPGKSARNRGIPAMSPNAKWHMTMGVECWGNHEGKSFLNAPPRAHRRALSRAAGVTGPSGHPMGTPLAAGWVLASAGGCIMAQIAGFALSR